MKKLVFTLALLIFGSQVFAQDLQLIVPTGHTRRVTDIELSGDMVWMASADGSNVVKLWTVADRQEFTHLHHDFPVQVVSFSPNADLILSGDEKGYVHVWSTAGDLRYQVQIGENALIDILVQDSRIVAITKENIALLDLYDETVIRTVSCPVEAIASAAINGDHLLVGNESGETARISLTEGTAEIQTVSQRRIGTITWINDQQAALGTDAGELIKLNTSSMEFEVTQPFSLRNYHIDYLPLSNQILALGRDQKQNLQCFDAKDLKSINPPLVIEVDKDSEVFKFGLRAATITNDSLLIIADYHQDIQLFDLKNKQRLEAFKGNAGAIYDMSVDRTGQWLAIASDHNEVKVLNLPGTAADRFLTGSNEGSMAVDFHPVNPVLAVYGNDQKIQVINAMNDERIFELKAKGDYSATAVTFDPSGNYLLRKSSESDFDFYNFKNNAPRNLKVKNGKKYVFSANGKQLIFSTEGGLEVFSAMTHDLIKTVKVSEIQDLDMSGKGQLAVLLRNDQTLKIFDNQYQEVRSYQLENKSDKIKWTPDGQYLIGIRNSVSRGEHSADFSIKIYHALTGKLTKKLPGHAGFVTDLEFVNGRLLTSAIDGKIKIWNLAATDPEIGMIIPLHDHQYVVTTPVGMFDATSKAMDRLHYIKSGKMMALEQLKSAYYEPKLLSKLLHFNSEPIREAADLSGVNLYPEMSIKHPMKNNGKLGINLNANGGGIGRVVILINGKEVSSDVRSAATPSTNALEINYDITNHPFLYADKVSKVTIKAYNTDGTLSTAAKNLYVFGQKKDTAKPKLYAVIAGTSDYEGDDLDLKYAAKDASDLAQALEIGASAYLGLENTHITLLTTDQEKQNWPTKENIRKAFENYATQASANDLLLVYLSGHGVNKSGENSDFYYLTCAARDGDLNHSVQRENAAISSAEFTSYINAVPALKQILIIDACHSGRMASSLASSRSAMSSSQIRALERMKDRTGMFVLAGSAADAVSYETTLYGQGLLTYSLLFGMKGAALREDGFVDVLDLFQFAANKVPELAEEIGGIQKPEIRMPEDGKSFDIGRLAPAEREKINIKAPKPVYVHTRFQGESAIYDPLNISDLMDAKLMEASSKKDAPIVFVDDKGFSGAMMINGRYVVNDTKVVAKITLIKAGTKVNQFEIEAINADQLTDVLLQKVLTWHQ